MAKTNNSTPKAGHNSLAETGKDFVTRLENLNQQIEDEKASIQENVDAIKADIRQLLKDAKKAGVKAAVQATVRARKAARKEKDARDALDIADRDTFDNIRHALGDLADLPLGQAAMGGTDGAGAAATG